MKKFIESMWLLLIGLILVGTVYSGLTVFKEAKANDDFRSSQGALAEQIEKLEEKLANQEQTIKDLTTKSDDYQKELESVRKMAQAPKVIAGVTTPAPEPVIQTKTVTKTVLVPEKPKKEATIIVQGLGSYKVEVKSTDTAFSILQKAAKLNGFTIDYQQFSFGVMVNAIGGIKPVGNQYWAFYYNGKYSMVGASDQKVSANDTTFWQLEKF